MYKINDFKQKWMRTLRDPNEIHVYDDHCEMLLYVGRGIYPTGEKTIFDLDILDIVQKYRWGVTGGERGGYVYRYRSKKPKLRLLHHLILPPKEGLMIDHINMDKLDNTKTNLRYATNAQNKQNSMMCFNSTGVKGVSFYKPNGKYYGRVTCEGITHQSTYFKTLSEAESWTRNKRKEVHGEFANHGELASIM